MHAQHSMLLLCVGNPEMAQGAYLVEPVDNTKQTPESPSCPSAVKALAASGLAVAVSGAGVLGRCNPKGSNFHVSFGCGRLAGRVVSCRAAQRQSHAWLAPW